MSLRRSAGRAVLSSKRAVQQTQRQSLSWLSRWQSSTPDAALASSSTLPTQPSPEPTISTPQSIATTNRSTLANAFSTVNQAEIDHFSRLSSQWWNEKGEFGLLHKMNPTRMEFVRQKIAQGVQDDEGWSFVKRDRVDEQGRLIKWEGEAAKRVRGKWLEGLDVLDVGCGGGLLSESLARVGGNVLGIDASSHNIAIASLHASQDPFLPFQSDSPLVASTSQLTDPAKQEGKAGSLRYRHTSAEELLKEGKQYDVVCSMEVLEHVDSPGEFLKCLADMVKPGGHLILSTISRTPLSQLLTITMAEHVLRLVTPGTHTYSKFIKPSELLAFVRDEMGGTDVWEADGDGLVDGGREGGGVSVGEVRGIVYDPLSGQWRLWKEGLPFGDLCNYMFHIRKKSL
ncbi:hypothetical protein QFC22_004366 [Naganishia vaughanmartiniae]|uniref:Uncharacterized protein n=1 Tax=Naganishia vaughanmartiniae TaxID=1424756 RepID=A0ACC2X1K7_9TREE|nr:hypothetical protein QFC22_004366 [Naganishia vaughanmartiniae]